MPNFGASPGGGGGGGGGGGSFADTTQDQAYEKFNDFFDSTVAGMSEADLAAAMAGATMVGSVVGSMVGSRVLGGKRGGGGGLLGTAGSLMGSMVASEMAASSVKALHQKSIQRIQYKEDCQQAVARGEPMPDPPARSQWDDILEKAMETVKGVANATMNKSSNGNGQGDANRSSENGNNAASLAGNLWKTATSGVKQMAKANLEAKSSANTNTHRQ
jgi:hypothetical protein